MLPPFQLPNKWGPHVLDNLKVGARFGNPFQWVLPRGGPPCWRQSAFLGFFISTSATKTSLFGHVIAQTGTLRFKAPMEERTTLKPRLKPLLVGICRGIESFQGLCRISSIHNWCYESCPFPTETAGNVHHPLAKRRDLKRIVEFRGRMLLPSLRFR